MQNTKFGQKIVIKDNWFKKINNNIRQIKNYYLILINTIKKKRLIFLTSLLNNNNKKHKINPKISMNRFKYKEKIIFHFFGQISWFQDLLKYN